VADIDRLAQVHKLALLPQAIEELAEVFLHCEVRSGCGQHSAL
jgi:hypothetical protein